MTCGSKKHIEEALAKIRVKDNEDSEKEVNLNLDVARC